AGSVRVPTGTYDIMVTHGPEWEADQRRVTVADREVVRIDSALRHSVDTRGWLAADLHIHTTRSFDSKIQLDTRVVSEVAVGVELVVATDHNVYTDLQPVIEQLGYESLARGIVGDEFNFLEGHGGLYPVKYDAKGVDEGGFPDGGANGQMLSWLKIRFTPGSQLFPILHALP